MTFQSALEHLVRYRQCSAFLRAGADFLLIHGHEEPFRLPPLDIMHIQSEHWKTCSWKSGLEAVQALMDGHWITTHWLTENPTWHDPNRNNPRPWCINGQYGGLCMMGHELVQDVWIIIHKDEMTRKEN